MVWHYDIAIELTLKTSNCIVVCEDNMRKLKKGFAIVLVIKTPK